MGPQAASIGELRLILSTGSNYQVNPNFLSNIFQFFKEFFYSLILSRIVISILSFKNQFNIITICLRSVFWDFSIGVTTLDRTAHYRILFENGRENSNLPGIMRIMQIMSHWMNQTWKERFHAVLCLLNYLN